MKLCPVFHVLALGTVLFCATNQNASASPKPEAADLIIYNAKVLTLDSNSTVAAAIAVRGDKIVAVGKDKQVQRYKGAYTTIVDAHGNTVMPGIYDELVDSYKASVSEWKGAQPFFTSIAEAQEFIKNEAAHKATNEWIFIQHAYPSRLKEGRLPTKAELDAVAPKCPVYWDCGEVAVVNSTALEAMHLTARTILPVGSELGMDFATHTPTGLLRHASKFIKLPDAGPSITTQQRRDALKHLYALYNQEGITSIGESDANADSIKLFRDMADSGELTVRINCTRSVTPGTNLDETLAHLDALTNLVDGKSFAPTGAGDDQVRIGPLLVDVDGSLVSGTAYLRSPWGIGQMFQVSEPAYRGFLVSDPDFMTKLFFAAAQRGWQVTADCTGDAALDQVLACLEKVQFKTNITHRRFLLRNADFQAHQDWETCKKLGLAAEMEPTTIYQDGSTLLKQLGEKRLKYFECYKSWINNGLIVGAGSGHELKLDPRNHATPWSPWLGIWTAVTRQTAANDGIYVKEEQLTREEAIRFYTLNNARLHFEDAKKGSLEIGKLADLIVLDRDILNCMEDDIRDTKVQMTVLGGKVVYGAEPKPLYEDPQQLKVSEFKAPL